MFLAGCSHKNFSNLLYLPLVIFFNFQFYSSGLARMLVHLLHSRICLYLSCFYSLILFHCLALFLRACNIAVFFSLLSFLHPFTLTRFPFHAALLRASNIACFFLLLAFSHFNKLTLFPYNSQVNYLKFEILLVFFVTVCILTLQTYSVISVKSVSFNNAITQSQQYNLLFFLTACMLALFTLTQFPFSNVVSFLSPLRQSLQYFLFRFMLVQYI